MVRIPECHTLNDSSSPANAQKSTWVKVAYGHVLVTTRLTGVTLGVNLKINNTQATKYAITWALTINACAIVCF